jgi:hypothetical protein
MLNIRGATHVRPPEKNKTLCVTQRVKTASLTHLSTSRNLVILFTLITVVSPEQAIDLEGVCLASQRTILLRCTCRISPFLLFSVKP